MIVESSESNSKEDLDNILVDILSEMIYLHRQGFDNKLISENVEGTFNVLSTLFKMGSPVIDTFKEKGVEFILNKLGLDENSYLKNFLITTLGNVNLMDVPKLFTDCDFLTKKISESIPEAYLRQLEYEKGMGGVFMDGIRNSLYDVIRNSDFADKISHSISGIICPLVEKMTGKFEKHFEGMKSNLIGNIQA
jgi:hypothetical protein